jgi:hypothetical protein
MPGKKQGERRTAAKAIETFDSRVKCNGAFQFGGDASTGLGCCTVKLDGEKKEVAK